MHRPVSLTLLAAGVALLALPAAASAIVLSPDAAPLPGSVFQGGDGDQENAAPLADWQALGASPDLIAINDSAPDTVVDGKENAPVDWDLKTDPNGASPPKSNFLASWSYFDAPTFLYVAFDRAAPGGSAFLAFELNQDTRLWLNNNGDLIPCRTDGDLIISYEIQNANTIEIITQQWVSDSAVSAAEAAGPYTNGEGCAKTGHFAESDPGAANAQAAINYSGNPVAVTNPDGSVNNYLPRDPAAATFGEALFGEASLNVPGVQIAAGQTACFSFGSISAHSRTSRSVTAALADLVGPVVASVRNCTISGTKYNDQNANGALDSGEPTIAGWKVYLDLDNDGELDAGEPIESTNDQGLYVFADILPGTYTVREAPLDQQSEANQVYTVCTAPDPCSRTVTIDNSNPNSSGNDFLNVNPFSQELLQRKIHYSLRFRYSDKHQKDTVVARVFCHSVFCVLGAKGTLKIKPYEKRSGKKTRRQSFRLPRVEKTFEFVRGRNEAGSLRFEVSRKAARKVSKALRQDAFGSVRASVDVTGLNSLQPDKNKKRFRDIKVFSGPRNR